jgi:hypothetical protein
VQRHVDVTIGAIGFGLGLTATTDPRDGMCGWDNGCIADHSVACQLSRSITRDPSADQRCAGVTTQDEHAAFLTAFCQ